MAEHHRLLIIGSGPAGLTAAIYAARADLKPLVLEGEQPGGQLTITTDVENYPGFPEGIMGPELMDLFRAQAQRFGADTRWEQVVEVDLKASPKVIKAQTMTGKEAEYTADAVIISTGASAKYMGLESETALKGYGVSACATCDAPLFRGKQVLVVGGGDTAMEEASHLAKFCAFVSVIHRRDELRASKIMAQRVLKNENIDMIWDSVITFVHGDTDKGVTGVTLKNVKTGEETQRDADGLFLAIGHKPNTDIFKGQLEMDETGYLQVEPRSTQTAVPGVFAAGDVADSVYRQAVSAAGTGCMAALDAERWLELQAHEASEAAPASPQADSSAA